MILIIMMEMLHNIQIDQPASTHIDPDADEQDIDLYGINQNNDKEVGLQKHTFSLQPVQILST